jgi:ABC-type Fe3+ transport system permease subunit
MTLIATIEEGRSASLERARPKFHVGLGTLLAPPLVLVILFFGLPALYLLRMSFNYHPPGGFYETAWTLDNYLFLISTPNYARAIGQTFLLSLLTAALTVGFAFVFALRIWLSEGRIRWLYLGIALCPLLISEVTVIFVFQPHEPGAGPGEDQPTLHADCCGAWACLYLPALLHLHLPQRLSGYRSAAH